MADLTITKYAGQLAARLNTVRVSNKGSLGQEARETTGLQRIGILRANDGTTVTAYYDPSAHNILWDDGTPVLSQQ